MLSNIRAVGLRYACAIMLNKIVPSAVCRFRRFDVMQVTSILPPEVSLPELKIRWATSDADIKRAEELTRYCRQDHLSERACLATVGDETVGAMWCCKGRFHEEDLGLQIELTAEQHWTYAARIREDFRGQGIYRAIKSFVAPVDNKEVFQFAINPENRRSVRANIALGAKPIAQVVSFRFFGIGFCWVAQDHNSCIRLCRSMTFSTRKQPLVLSISVPANE